VPGKHMSYEEIEAEAARIARDLLENRSSSPRDPTFVTRDIGFAEHTKIHDFVRGQIALYAARIVVLDRMYGERCKD